MFFRHIAARAFRTTSYGTRSAYTAAPANGQMYRHYRGNDYIVVGTATHTETQELMVIYRAARLEDYFASGSRLFVRPVHMWRQVVTAPCGTQMPRFRAVTK